MLRQYRDMGILATVVYDVARHVTLVLRTPSATPAERNMVVDTIASFSAHAENLRGVATTVAEVSALWGGPPFITYQVVRSRFRVMVVWAEGPGEFDLAQDVHECVVRLQRVVAPGAEALAAQDPGALAKVYEEAGCALRGELAPVGLQGEDAAGKWGGGRRSSVASGDKRDDGKRKSVFGRLGKALIKGAKTGAGGNEKPGRRPARNPSANRSASQALSLVGGSSMTPFDDAPSELDLPNEMFAWSDFGQALPESDNGDLEWFAHLIRGMEKQKTRARPPVIRSPTAPPSLPVSSTPTAAIEPGPSAGSAQPTNEGQSPQTPVSNLPAASFSTPSAVASAGALSPLAPMTLPPVISAPSPVQQLVAPSPPIPPPPSAVEVAPPAVTTRTTDEDFDIAGLGTVKDPTATSTTAMEQQPAQSLGVSDPVRGRMNEFANSMQSGNFAVAMRQVAATLKFLSQERPPREREITTCANYLLAQKILIRKGTLEAELQQLPAATPDATRRHLELALLTMFLAELKHLLPRHRVAAMKMAVEKNIVVGNYGMASRWLQHLVEKAPPAQKPVFAQKMQLCAQSGGKNAHMPSTNRLCYNTLRVITSPTAKCSFCPAVYHPTMAGIVSGQLCPVCGVGNAVLVQ